MRLDEITPHSEIGLRIKALVHSCREENICVTFAWKPWDSDKRPYRGPNYHVFGPDKDHEELIKELLEALDIHGAEEDKNLFEALLKDESR